ncbi:MAG: zinc ribbon domain-containing protein [Phycisphaerales bacterium]|nr:zinc ribbon domain-containing protein [Phycisphaerales bacterium]MCB9854746.1 zinc ribbon domain-containing protein [Phycisphaerales bacterium]
MPTYEYQCGDCGSVFDVFQSIKAQPLRKADCENCGEKTKVRRLIGTGGAVIFKGSGFYQTDYRSDSYKKAATAESGDGKSADGDKVGKTEDSNKSKADAKPKKDAANKGKPKK